MAYSCIDYSSEDEKDFYYTDDDIKYMEYQHWIQNNLIKVMEEEVEEISQIFDSIYWQFEETENIDYDEFLTEAFDDMKDVTMFDEEEYKDIYANGIRVW